MTRSPDNAPRNPCAFEAVPDGRQAPGRENGLATRFELGEKGDFAHIAKGQFVRPGEPGWMEGVRQELTDILRELLSSPADHPGKAPQAHASASQFREGASSLQGDTRLREQLSAMTERFVHLRSDFKERLAAQSAELARLQQAIASAEEWQQQKWHKRAFRRWRPPGQEAGLAEGNRDVAAIEDRAIDAAAPQRFWERQWLSLQHGQTAVGESLMRLGAKIGLTKRLRRLGREARLLANEGLVSSRWYCRAHPEAGLRPRDAVMHYLRTGAALGWDPNPFFDTSWYLERYPDVAAAGWNPLVHFAQQGWKEERDPSVRFETKWYLDQCPKVRKSKVNPLSHFLKTGRAAGLSPVRASWFAPRRANSTHEEVFSPEVTVVVPNYNHAPYLRQRLDSIYGQSYRNFRVILLDDCSNDESRAILEEYARKYPERTELVVNTVNGRSVFAQWRKGIQSAQSGLIWIAESDDFAELGFLETVIPFFQDEAVMIAYSRTVFVGPNGTPLDFTFDGYVSSVGHGARWTGDYVETAHREVATALGIRNTIPNVSSAVFRNPGELALLDDPEWLRMRACGDWVFYLHVARGGKIAYTNHTKSYYRYHQANASRSSYLTPDYYREHETVARTVAQLYRVEPQVFERHFHFLREHWDCVFKDQPQPSWNLEDCYNVVRIREAAASRLPNVLIVTHDLSTGGGEIFPIRLAEALAKQGYGVTFFNFEGSTVPATFRDLLPANIPVIHYEGGLDLKQMLEHLGIDIVHTHHARTDDRFARLFSPGESRPRHVVTMHGMYEVLDAADLELRHEMLQGAVDHWVYIADKNLDPFIINGLCGNARFTKIPVGMSLPEPSPVDRANLGIPSDAFVVCLASRALFEKGWLEAVLAIEMVREQTGRDVHLVLVGEGPAAARLREAGTPSFVHLVGFQRSPVDYFAMADLGLLPTRYRSESCPLVIIECMMAGRPVVSCDVGEIASMLTAPNGKMAGTVIRLEDWMIPVQDLAAAIRRFVDDERAYSEATGAVAAARKRFDLHAIAQGYGRIYAECQLPDSQRSSGGGALGANLRQLSPLLNGIGQAEEVELPA